MYALHHSDSPWGVLTTARVLSMCCVTARWWRLCRTVVAAEADPTLKKANDGFVDAVSEHFAMLFVSGAAPLQLGGSGRSGSVVAKEAAAAAAAVTIATAGAAKTEAARGSAPGATGGGADKRSAGVSAEDKAVGRDRGAGRKDAAAAATAATAEEEDTEMPDAAKDGAAPATATGAAEIAASKDVRAKRRAASSLKELDACLFLDALMDALESGKRPHMEAGLHAVKVFPKPEMDSEP